MDMSFLAWLVPCMVAMLLLLSLGNFRDVWPRRSVLMELAVALLLTGFPFLLVTPMQWLTKLLLVLLQLWLLLLVYRLLFGRLDEQFLRASTWHSTLLASTILLTIFLIESGFLLFVQAAEHVLLWLLLASGLVVAMVLINQVVWTFKHYRLRKLLKHRSLKDLPTVTLAITARNETSVLTECLTAAVASDYPKLEILVLDDCSQDQTSELIRSFAHEGVRFIQGDQPTKGWLGKNQASKVLAEQASGEYIIFAGVDTRLAPQSISKLINYTLSNAITMVTVLPQQRETIKLSTLLPPLRYYWQIVLPNTRRRVAVATQCWLIEAEILRQLGGFKAVKHKIVPEGSFARRLFARNKYRFIVSDSELGITTAKRWSSQHESSIRYLYPTFKRQPLYVLLGSIVLASVLFGPFAAVFLLSFSQSFTPLWWMAVLVCMLLLLGYALTLVRTHPRSWVLTMLFFPFALLQEIALIILSMLLYEFGEVNWKGRNVCYPVIAVPPGRLIGHK